MISVGTAGEAAEDNVGAGQQAAAEHTTPSAAAAASGQSCQPA